jgi:hypothetical protein
MSFAFERVDLDGFSTPQKERITKAEKTSAGNFIIAQPYYKSQYVKFFSVDNFKKV